MAVVDRHHTAMLRRLLRTVAPDKAYKSEAILGKDHHDTPGCGKALGAIPSPLVHFKKTLRLITNSTQSSTIFHTATRACDHIKVTSASPLTFYAERDAEHCQSFYVRTSIPGSSIGDISPCVEPLFLLSSQSFTNERRAYRLVRTRSASIWHGMPTALVRNKPSQN